MDPGAYDTNSLLLNDISAISFSVYEPAAELSPHSPPTTTLEIETALRDKGHIIYHDHDRGQYWHFELLKKDNEEMRRDGINVPAEFQSSSFSLVDDGIINPATLHKARAQPPAPVNAPPTPSSTGVNPDNSSRFAMPIKPESPEEASGSKQTKTDARSPITPLLYAAYANFICAILLMISNRLAATTGGLLLNYRTLLLDSSESSSSGTDNQRNPTICTLNAYVTTAGTLVFKLDAKSCHGLSVGQDHGLGGCSPSAHMLTAPFGMLALDAHYDPGAASVAQTPVTQVMSARGALDHYDTAWRRTCKKVLQLRGINPKLLERCSWSHVVVSNQPKDGGSSSVLPWPSPLCVRKKALPLTPGSRLEHEILKSNTEQHDPLGLARTWFSTSQEREEHLAIEKTERHATDSKEETNIGVGSSRIAILGSDIRRPSTIAASPMYPTPPDGVQHHNGITPSFDANVSSPKDAPSTAAGLDLDTEMSNIASDNKATADVFDQDRWDADDASKRERNESNLLADASSVLNDMGGDMFDDNDVTEDDFNFFDEAPTPEGVGLQPARHASIPVEPLDQDMSEQTTTEDKISANDGLSQKTKVAAPTDLQVEEPVFAKPELRHARSSLQAQPGGRARDQADRPTSAKRERSPFNAETVFKRVRAFLETNSATRSPQPTSNQRRYSVFGALRLDPSLPMLDKKYQPGGIFAFNQMQEDERRRRQSDSAAITRPSQLASQWGDVDDGQDSTGRLLRRFTALDTGASVQNSRKAVESGSEDGSSGDSDSDESSFTTEDPSSPLRLAVKPKTDDDVASQVISVKEADPGDDNDSLVPFQIPHLAKSEKPDLSISRFFQDPDPITVDPSISDEEVIQLAQILTEQAATGLVQMSDINANGLGKPDYVLQRTQMAVDARDVLRLVQQAGVPFMRQAIHAKLKDLVEVQDAAVSGQPSRLQPRVIPGREPYDTMRAVNFYPLPMPHLEVRRADNKVSLLATAVTFWESLGLAPVHGAKEVAAACIFPKWAGVHDNVSNMLHRLKNVYEILKLGSFENLEILGGQPGQLPYDPERISTSSAHTGLPNLPSIIDALEPLRSSAHEWSFSGKNVVLYFVYSTQQPVTIIEACAAFQNFFEFYRKVLATRKEACSPNELVLQLVSLESISSTTSLVQPTPESLRRRCIELYDRCTSFEQPMPAPSITLEQPVPRHVNFECSPKASASLIHEHSCMHVAYAQSVDERWVTAAWTDDRGCQQSTASYCLGRKGKTLSSSMNEIAHEIWETTMDLISTYKVQWRIVIAKSGPLEADETKFWVDLARTQDRNKAKATLTILSVDSRPSLQLLPAAAKVSHSAIAFGATPESTPQSSVFSPDQAPTPATPARDPTTGAAGAAGNETGSEPEGDSSLVDVKEQTWAALAGHRLGTAPSILELQPALFSGWLVKRTGPSLDEPPAVLEVNLVHSDHLPRQYEASMREVLSWYRALGTLARARGVTEEADDVRPWHIAAAEKAVRTLYLLL